MILKPNQVKDIFSQNCKKNHETAYSIVYVIINKFKRRL
jgi:hypothetical protein